MSTVNKKIKYPTSTMDITLDTLVGYMDSPDELKADVTFVLTHFTVLTKEEVVRMDIESAQKICNSIFGALQRMEPPCPQIIRVDGVEYGLIPDVDEMTIGEFMDIDKYFNDYHDWAKAMAVIYRPIVRKRKVMGRERYEIETYKGTTREAVNRWLHAPCSFALGARSFFLTLGEILAIATNRSSKEGLTPTPAKPTLTVLPDSVRNTDGSHT